MSAGSDYWASLPLGPGVALLNRDANGLAALNKPAGVLSHPNRPADEPRSLLAAPYVRSRANISIGAARGFTCSTASIPPPRG